VLDISPVDRRVTVGPREALAVGELVAADPKWCGVALDGDVECLAQFRAHGTPVAATISVVRPDNSATSDVRAVEPDNSSGKSTVHVRFDEPQEGVAPGQAIVLYDDTRVIGSATIDATSAHASSSLAGHHQ
jgi:tRNA-specific 2-thiouridylase